MRLFIAEKPELAKAIVEGLGGGSRKNGYYECGDDRVTWCFGHMLKLCDPEDYDARYSKWNMADLPISHIPWKKKPAGDKQDQLDIIIGLISQAESIVNAGDPDEEGQLLVDEIIEYANCNAPVKRVLVNDNNTKIVKKALANLRDNSEFAGLSAAAEARSVGDQLYGYNMTRAYTLSAREAGHQGVLSVGRGERGITRPAQEPTKGRGAEGRGMPRVRPEQSAGPGLDGQGATGPQKKTKKKRPEGRSTGAAQPPYARGMDAERPRPGIAGAWFTTARSGEAGRALLLPGKHEMHLRVITSEDHNQPLKGAL